MYAPVSYNATSPIVKTFWQVRSYLPIVWLGVRMFVWMSLSATLEQMLENFTDEERASFLQFAWARSRLPSDESSYRMQVCLHHIRSHAASTPEPRVTVSHLALFPAAEYRGAAPHECRLRAAHHRDVLLQRASPQVFQPRGAHHAVSSVDTMFQARSTHSLLFPKVMRQKMLVAMSCVTITS